MKLSLLVVHQAFEDRHEGQRQPFLGGSGFESIELIESEQEDIIAQCFFYGRQEG